MQKLYKLINSKTKEVCVAAGSDEAYFFAKGYQKGEVGLGYDGKWYLSEYVPQLTVADQNEQIRLQRKTLYQEKVDPLTAQIQRLRDQEIVPETAAEIEAVLAERAYQVAVVRTSLAYLTEEENNA